jgi:hypothetical protein
VLSKATPRISIVLQIGDQKVKQRLQLHLSHIDHIMIQSELRDPIGENAFAAGTGETHQVTGQGGFIYLFIHHTVCSLQAMAGEVQTNNPEQKQ